MYQIIGKYQHEPQEIIDEAETMKEAEQLLAEYRMAFGAEWKLRIKKTREAY